MAKMISCAWRTITGARAQIRRRQTLAAVEDCNAKLLIFVSEPPAWRLLQAFAGHQTCAVGARHAGECDNAG